MKIIFQINIDKCQDNCSPGCLFSRWVDHGSEVELLQQLAQLHHLAALLRAELARVVSVDDPVLNLPIPILVRDPRLTIGTSAEEVSHSAPLAKELLGRLGVHVVEHGSLLLRIGVLARDDGISVIQILVLFRT